MSNLCFKLIEKYLLGNRSEDLNEAIIAGRQTLSALPDGSKTLLMTRIAWGLFIRYTRTYEMDDLDQAINYFLAASELLFDDQKNKLNNFNWIAYCFQARYNAFRDDRDREQAHWYKMYSSPGMW